MSLGRQKLKGRELKDKIKKVVQEECFKENTVPKNTYNIFFAGKNTGEQVKLPNEDSIAFGNVISRIPAEYNMNVSLTHRNMYLNLED